MEITKSRLFFSFYCFYFASMAIKRIWMKISGLQNSVKTENESARKRKIQLITLSKSSARWLLWNPRGVSNYTLISIRCGLRKWIKFSFFFFPSFFFFFFIFTCVRCCKFFMYFNHRDFPSNITFLNVCRFYFHWDCFSRCPFILVMEIFSWQCNVRFSWMKNV